jgi:hypothetical protein
MCNNCFVNVRKVDFELKEGDTFRSKWFSGLVTVLKVDREKNSLSVTINPQAPERGSWTESDWDLKVTIYALQSGEYYNFNKEK